MKKISLFVLAIVAVSAMAMGCSKKKAETTPETPAAEPATGGDMYGGAAYGG